MKKIAILTCLDACQVCTGAGCLNAWNSKSRNFAAYAGEGHPWKPFSTAMAVERTRRQMGE